MLQSTIPYKQYPTETNLTFYYTGIKQMMVLV